MKKFHDFHSIIEVVYGNVNTKFKVPPKKTLRCSVFYVKDDRIIEKSFNLPPQKMIIAHRELNGL